MEADLYGFCLLPPQHPWLRQQGVAMERPLDSVVLSRMKKFSAMNKLRKAALLVIAKSLSADEINGAPSPRSVPWNPLQLLCHSADEINGGC